MAIHLTTVITYDPNSGFNYDNKLSVTGNLKMKEVKG